MSSDGKISPRETAWRVFAHELNASNLEIKATEEKMPSYIVSPLGAKMNRVLIAGTLTEKYNSGTEDEPMWRGRIQDVNGQFYISAGRYQPEALISLADLEPPCFVAAVGRLRLYSPEDGKSIITVRPERIVKIDEKTLGVWLLETAKSAWTRLKWTKETLNAGYTQAADLVKMGMTPAQAENLLYALDSYEQPESDGYLKTIQNALRRLLPEDDIDFGFPEGVEDVPDEIDSEEEAPAAATRSHGQMEDIVMGLLDELDADGKGAPRDELERRSEAEGINAIELEEITNLLMDKGLVYEPNLRYLKLI